MAVMTPQTLLSFAASLSLAATAFVAPLAIATSAQAQTAALKPVPVLRGLDSPWALAFLPDGRMLVTERPGRLRVALANGELSPPLAGLPAVSAGGQCGLLDVAVDPQFAQNQRIFFTFAEPAGPGESGNSTAVGSARLVGDGLGTRLESVRTIFSQKPKISSRNHCGSRIVFDRSGALLVGLGDRFSGKDEAQNPANHIGKVVRISAEGQALPDNPFAGKAGTAPEIFSLGHRNIQGAALHPQTGELWAVEHGPQGGDEINRVQAGRNYGWPLVTYGRNYGIGTAIGEPGPKAGFEQPLRHWVPTSVAPSGLVFLTSDRYPGWKGSAFTGTLRGQALIRLTLDGASVTGEERLLADFGQRIRDVRQGPDGWLYIVTDGDGGQVLRLER
jgi:glucose/arabinose dehydrogenase